MHLGMEFPTTTTRHRRLFLVIYRYDTRYHTVNGENSGSSSP
jgi:hypothetical protein